MANRFVPKSVFTFPGTVSSLKVMGFQPGWLQIGSGVISGMAPEYFARLGDGTPAANILVELYLNGLRIKITKTSSNGSWKFEDLDPNLLYDVVARHGLLEAVISTKRQPVKQGITVYELPYSPNNDDVSTTATRRFVVKNFDQPLTVSYGPMFPITQNVNQQTGLVTLRITKQSTEQTYVVRFSSFDETDYRDVNVVVPPNA